MKNERESWSGQQVGLSVRGNGWADSPTGIRRATGAAGLGEGKGSARRLPAGPPGLNEETGTARERRFPGQTGRSLKIEKYV